MALNDPADGAHKCPLVGVNQTQRGQAAASESTQSGPHIRMQLNDIDQEMTTLCQDARSVPIYIEMDADVPNLDQLLNNAAECIRLAEAARTSEHKSLFIEMAERWLALAEHAAGEGRVNSGSLFRDRLRPQLIIGV